jgi:hypothetical protein
MAYYILFLTTSDEREPFHELTNVVDHLGEAYSLCLIEGTDAEWVELSLTHRADDRAIGDLRCKPVRNGVPDDPGVAELASCLAEIEDCLPACNVPWLRRFLPQVRTVYVWSLYGSTSVNDGWAPVRQIIEFYTDCLDTAVYAEMEGWTNTVGDHITWEFTDRVRERGELWSFGLHLDQRWHHFQMDLGDREGEECFKRGVVPPGVKVRVDEDDEPEGRA